MLNTIQDELFFITGKVLALEFNNFKDSNSNIQDSFFEKYIEKNFLSKDGYINTFLKYPTLARILTVRTQYLLNFFKEILSRINKDKNELIQFFDIGSHNLELCDIDLSNGDSHNQGRSVCILHFNQKKVVYKPRNLKINESINVFVDWFTKKHNLKKVKFPQGLYKEKYSYIEYISFKDIKSNQGVRDYYIRYGYLIALAYILNITDIHLENLIAHGEYPVIIDIETSFQNESPLEYSLPIKIMNILNFNSIKASGLLPKSIEIKDQENLIELAALNGKKQKLSKKGIVPLRPSKDEFFYSKVGELQGPTGQNIPKTTNGEEVDYNQFRNLIVEGCIQFLDKIKLDKKNVINKLNDFKKIKLRILLKSTERYYSMIRFSNHPNYNREMKFRERLLMNIWSYPYSDKRPIISEIRDLIYNDIPIFETFAGSRHLFDSKGLKYQDYFRESGLNKAIKKVELLDEKEILLQKSILLTTLGITDEILNVPTPLVKLKSELTFDLYQNPHILNADIISNKAIKYKGQASFINLQINSNLEWSIVPANESLYDGLSGIALMYLFAYINSEEEKYFDLYKKIMRMSLNLSQEKPILSAFEGYLSPIYPILLEIKYIGSSCFETYLDDYIESLKNLQTKLINIANYDFISGSSGIITILSALYKLYSKDSFLLDIIDKLSDLLMTNLTKTNILKKDNPVGIAHGISGIILSLVKVDKISATDISRLLSYEDEFNISKENKYKWCKGVTGKLQARLHILKYKVDLYDELNLESCVKEFERLLKYIPQDDCLCHGTTGILVTLKLLYNHSHDKKWLKYIKTIYSNVYINALASNYKVKQIYDIQSIGLFDGVSGIVWGNMFLTSDNIVNIQTMEI